MQKIRPDMDIGKNIQAIRYKNNMTQDQVVAKLNLMWLKINGFEEKLQVRKNKRIERRVEEIDKEKIKVNLEQKEIDKNELVAELEKMRNYLMKIKSENNELHIETFDIIEIAMDKKIKKKEK